jgi:hypothetical protein
MTIPRKNTSNEELQIEHFRSLYLESTKALGKLEEIDEIRWHNYNRLLSQYEQALQDIKELQNQTWWEITKDRLTLLSYKFIYFTV